MIDRIFFDTNMIVYLYDLRDPIKRKKITRLLHGLIDKARLIISSQVINEFINYSTKKIVNEISEKELSENLLFLNELFVISPLSFSTSMEAIKIKKRYKYSFWDSLIIASALESDCNFLFTEDLQNAQILNSKLKIINPFIENI